MAVRVHMACRTVTYEAAAKHLPRTCKSGIRVSLELGLLVLTLPTVSE